LEWKDWICKGLIAANYTTWAEVFYMWDTTSKKVPNDILLEYLTCSTDPETIRNYFRLTMQYQFYLRIPDNRKRATIILLIIAKHAKRDEILELIFESLKFKIKK